MDKSIGRGNANIYYLLKKPKGCNLCPFNKGGHFDGKRGHLSPEKGTKTTPYIDSIDNKDTSEQSSQIVEVSDSEERPKKVSRAKYPHALEVFRMFGEYPKSWERDTTQLTSAEALYNERGVDEIKNALAWFDDLRDREFCPQVNTPRKLDTKWVDFEKFVEKQEV